MNERAKPVRSMHELSGRDVIGETRLIKQQRQRAGSEHRNGEARIAFHGNAIDRKFPAAGKESGAQRFAGQDEESRYSDAPIQEETRKRVAKLRQHDPEGFPGDVKDDDTESRPTSNAVQLPETTCGRG